MPVHFRARALRASVWLAIVMAAQLCGQISPGPLSTAHQSLEGMSKCGSCHDFGAATRGFKCLECHVEIRKRVEARSGFHARAYKASTTQADCVRCHMEHNGRNFVVTRLERKGFDHVGQTGFALEGKHRAQKCESCHTAKHVAAAVRTEIKFKDVNRSFLGLRRECTNCHEDRHGGQLGVECVRCHSQEGWKPAPGFSHAKTRFVLTGLHQNVSCQKCHGPKEAGGAAHYKELSFAGCQGCHTDPHRGAFQEAKFKGTCDSCHTTGGWKTNRPATGFNHSGTAFPLTGKHADKACGVCHKSSDFKKAIAHERCQDCHEDAHNRQFVGRAGGADCGACHKDTGFKPSRFDREAHRQAAFALEGKHATVQCGECHQPEGKGAVYKSGKLICSACHSDAHGGEFRRVANKCDLCHEQTGFEQTKFTVARHEETKFPLTGKHASVKCVACHKTLVGSPAPVNGKYAGSGQPRQYHFASQTCTACHTDPHQTGLKCESCHTTQQWNTLLPRDSGGFDHSSTGFKLEAAHQGPTCVQCHVASAVAARAVPVFAKTPGRCSDCHQGKDIHRGQFLTGQRERDCSSCHTSTAWKTVKFDHDSAQFTLDRAHRYVACAKCHKDQADSSGKMMHVYRGTPVDCVKCH